MLGRVLVWFNKHNHIDLRFLLIIWPFIENIYLFKWGLGQIRQSGLTVSIHNSYY